MIYLMIYGIIHEILKGMCLTAMEKLLQILNSIRSDVDFASETLLIDNGVLDSFDIISLVTELNSEYGINIGVVDLVPENFNNVQAIAALIERLS